MPGPETLPVHLSREDLHAIETVESFEATGPFSVEILNHGRDAHPHLKLSDSLAEVATIEEGNPYVPKDDAVRVRIDASPGPEPVSGSLKVEAGYGAESTAVEVTIRRPTEEAPVDERSSRRATDESGEDEAPVDEMSTPEVGISAETLPVVALAIVALVIAALTAAVVKDLVVVVGVTVVLGAVVTAGVLLLR